MRYGMGPMAAVLLWVMMGQTVEAAGEASPPIPDADEIIATCRDIAQKMNRAASSSAEESIAKEAPFRCIESHIKENMRILIDEDWIKEGKNFPGGIDPLTAGQNIDDIMTNVYSSIFNMYYQIYENNRLNCLSCTGYWHGRASRNLAIYYEDVLRRILKRRRYHEQGEEDDYK